jgi:hypothetical protein
MTRIFRFLVTSVALAMLAGGCVISKNPVFGADTRALPFASGTRFQIYERENGGAPWKLSDKAIVFVADAGKIVREVDDNGKIDDKESYTFHPLGTDRYLVQARFQEGRYAYAVLEMSAREGILTALQCKRIERALLKEAGVKIDGEDCVLDGARDAAGFLKQLATKPAGSQIKYVPVQKK